MKRNMSGPCLKPRVLFPSSPLEEATGQSVLFTLGQTPATIHLHFLEIKISHRSNYFPSFYYVVSVSEESLSRTDRKSVV